MKTAYYTFTVWDSKSMAAGSDSSPGEGRQTAMVRGTGGRTVRGGDKVIDLNAWRADNPDKLGEEPDGSGRAWSGPEWEEPEVFTARTRGSRRSMPAAELVSTLSVVAAALALILRVLTF